MNAYLEMMDNYGEKILQWSDPDNKFRGYTEGWLFTDFRTAGSIAIAYVIFATVGPMIMNHFRIPAMDPYPIKFFYNVTQIFLCAYMTIEAFLLAYRNDYSVLPCVGYDRSNPAIANVFWLFYVSKIWDFWDTIFIVLGKKWRQLSFLHVYHHFTIFLFCWLNVHVNYDGDVYLTIVLNGFIHTVMYTYYFICMHTKVPETGKTLPIWWKSSLTMMQLIQFVVMMTQSTYLISGQCPQISLRVIVVYFLYILSIFLLFAEFYVSSYTTRGKLIKQKKH